MRIWIVLAVLFGLASCVERVPTDGTARILAMGDSLMAWNTNSGRGIPDALETRLDQPVVDRSVPGASFFYAPPLSGGLGLRIEAQLVAGDWDWVVLNGGGNDLWLGCGCQICGARLDRLVSEDGSSGAVPALVAKLRQTGAQVAYVGYLRTPGFSSPIERCGPWGARFEERLDRMAARDPGVVFVSNADLVPDGDRSFHARDLIHPSPKGSAAIAARIARTIGY